MLCVVLYWWGGLGCIVGPSLIEVWGFHGRYINVDFGVCRLCVKEREGDGRDRRWMLSDVTN